MKRTPLRRKTPLRSRSRINPRATARPRPQGYEDPDYIAWLKTQPCRVTGKVGGNVGHHLRHTSTGAAMGARLKDDRRAITLSVEVHIPQLHGNAGFFKGWARDGLREWENLQLKEQRSEWEKQRDR